MRPLVFAFPGNETLGRSLAQALGAEIAAGEVRRFPDEESYVRIDTPVAGRTLILLCTLDRPDEKFLPLHFAAATARALGAARVGLVCPYLAYMRQDKAFRPGEAISSAHFAQLLGQAFDWLVTVDPHLHRHHSLTELFGIPAVAEHAAASLADWVARNVTDPFLIGPDLESEQWVGSVASLARAPYLVLEKVRRGDREVEVSAPDIGPPTQRTPVLVDDIISTGRTMIDTLRQLLARGERNPICVGVHAVFSGDAYKDLRAAGAARIVTCNTIPHESNAIDLSERLAHAVRAFIGAPRQS